MNQRRIRIEPVTLRLIAATVHQSMKVDQQKWGNPKPLHYLLFFGISSWLEFFAVRMLAFAGDIVIFKTVENGAAMHMARA